MKSTIIFLILFLAANIEFAFADYPHLERCPKITSIVEPIGSSAMKNGFTTYSTRSNEPYPAEKFIGADIKKYNIFSCNYEVSDGMQVTVNFTKSRCLADAGFDSSGKCTNPDPEQCTAFCAY